MYNRCREVEIQRQEEQELALEYIQKFIKLSYNKIRKESN